MDRDEALKLLRGGPHGIKEWNRRQGEKIPDLSGADLSEANLRGADLSGAVLGGHHFSDRREIQNWLQIESIENAVSRTSSIHPTASSSGPWQMAQFTRISPPEPLHQLPKIAELLLDVPDPGKDLVAQTGALIVFATMVIA